MHAFLLGRRDRRLFATYDPPSPTAGMQRAAVICAPWGKEYLNSHRALRLLSSRLAAAGCHALRFDWYGCGDSHGESDEGDVEGWKQDVEVAVEELQAISGSPQVHLIGLRLGAALAFEASRLRSDIAGLALWDPVVDGRVYVRDLIGMDDGASAPTRDDGPGAETSIGLLGFPLTRAQREGIETIEIDGSKATVRDLFVLLSENRAEYAPLRESLEPAHEVAVEAGPKAWVEQPEIWAGAIPVPQIERIVTWLAHA